MFLTRRPPKSWQLRQATMHFSEVRFVRGSSLNNLHLQTGGLSSKYCALVITEYP